MFYSWSDANKITTKSLQIQYVGTYHKMYWGQPVYEFHRLATKEYQYVGMTEAAAKKCQEAKLAQYTRTFVLWNNENGNLKPQRNFVSVANVSMDSDGDGLWTVSISVSEDQVQYSRYAYSADSIPYDLFDLSLDYDESPAEGGYLRITSVYRENQRLYIEYQQEISGFDRASQYFKAENSTDSGQTWTQMTPTSSTEGQMYFNSGAWLSGLVRLTWQDVIRSNVEQTPSSSYSNTLELAPPYWQVIGGEDAAWRVQYLQSFPNFDSAKLSVETRPTPQDNWNDITPSCMVLGDRITTPYVEQETLFYMRAKYDGYTSNSVNNMSHFLVVDNDLSVQIEQNQVANTTLSYHQSLEGYDQSKVTIRYSDAGQTRTFNNNEIVFTQDGQGNCTATVNPGNYIIINPMTVNITLVYNGVDVSRVSKKVYRTS